MSERKWTAADVPEELQDKVGQMKWNATWKDAIAAIANALNVPPPGEPEGECVEVRGVWGMVEPDEWVLFGVSGFEEVENRSEAFDWMKNAPVATGTFTARLPIPKPVEVAARVEVGDE